MARLSKDIDSAFHGVGTKGGLEIWCIENCQPVPIPKPSFGKFYSGNAYIVLNTVLPKTGPPQHDIHYWLGNAANEVDSLSASDKALELDAALGCCTVQYREVQGQETEKFLSYFKPCIIPVEGKYSSEPVLADQTYQISLLMCKGDHAIRVKEVNFCRSSLNHDDVFILDTASKIFLFAGCNSSTQERAKALEVVEYIKDSKHEGRCHVATIEDGKFVGDSDVGEFWSFFGGYAPIPRESSSASQEQFDTTQAKMFWIDTQGKLHPTGSCSLNKEMLEKNKCYMLDCGGEVFIWMGRNTTITERKTSISASEDFLRREGRSFDVHLTFLTEGLENAKFRSFFDSWPQTVESTLYTEGREKVAAIFKQQGYDVKELPDEEDEVEPYMNCQGTLKVWRRDGDELSLLPIPDQTKFFSGDCYIVQYTYPFSGRDEHLFYVWIGCESMQQDRVDAISHLSAVVASTKGEPVMAQIYQGNEPPRFFPMFQSLVVFKGGMSKRYMMFLEEKENKDELSTENKASLFRVQGTSPKNMQAIQVDSASTSLNSSYCYILTNGASIFTWIGSLSSASDHDLLDRMLYFIDPSWQPISVREGSEPDTFWDLLGGKAEYPKEKETRRQVEEPHLFTCSCSSDDIKVKEIYNFVQDDLTTEDVLLLDCQSEVYVWIGLNSKVNSKQQALTLGLKFLEMDILEEGLSKDTPICVVTEGHEPPFFTRFFEWDSTKANMHGNSFERKLASLKGKKTSTETSGGSHWRSYSRENTSNGSRSRSVPSTGVSPGANQNLSSLRSADDQSASSQPPIARKLSLGAYPMDAIEEPSPDVETSKENLLAEVDAGLDSLTYSYQRLRVDSQEPVTGIDVARREAYLSKEEFEERFKMTKAEFYTLPKWKQNKLKMSLHLF
ncbi:PREDICTED: villin-1 isoform X2 [Tarenaya hassleriana]|uniref:villin-1 isoform X2 n=1 Tax=Tarenaya hassleriana TaxID=28532 RepID=UPI00053C1D9A|nr:PREDICTED: villin-1 isoform X2 [Tarenaya hassleriana]